MKKDPTVRDQLLDEIIKLEVNLTEIPVLPKLFTNDVTPESLATSVQEQGGCFAIISDEGGIIETLGGLYSNGVANVDILLKGIDGGLHRVRRRDREYDLKPILTIVLAFQPQILNNMAERGRFAATVCSIGFCSCIPRASSDPEPTMGRPSLTRLPAAFRNRVLQLLYYDPTQNSKQVNGGTLTLDPDASHHWRNFQAAIELELRPTGHSSGARGWGGKLPGFTLRIAGLLHLATKFHLESSPIPSA